MRRSTNHRRRLSIECLENRILLAALQETLVARGDLWKYLDDGSDQGMSGEGPGWFGDVNYDDSGWSEEPAELGYGDTQQTLVNFIDTDPGTPGDQKNATTYFRRTFNISDPANRDFTIFLKHDDGAAIYINGVEVVRTLLAANADFNTFASSTVADEESYQRFDISSGPIVAGANVIAVEIHQASDSSSDISFDMELVSREPLISQVDTEVVASGLNRPVYVTSPAGDADRLFIVEQSGVIRIVDLQNDTLLATPFLDISSRVRSADSGGGNEQGLLGLAFSPNFSNNGEFYVNYTASAGNISGDTIVSRFSLTANPDIGDANSEEVLLTIDQPFSNHNGGWIDFGPDGFLYIATGDGGSGNDPDNNAQDITSNRLGKMLRIDVDGPPEAGLPYAIPASNPFVGVAGDDEIWAYGLRNPWRNSFDRETGDLYIADVGQNAFEEIDVQPAASSGGENYGWRVMEGNRCNFANDPLPCNDNSFVDPVFEYPRGGVVDGDLQFWGRSTTGGYVYRGPVEILDGHYFFGDFVSSRVWSFAWDGGGATELIDWTEQLLSNGGGVASFGEDDAGNVYIADFSGRVHRITGPGFDSLTVAAVELNAQQVDPADRPAGSQPTSWSQQRADILDITVTFSEAIAAVAPADLVLTNLGVDAPAVPDQTVTLNPNQISVVGNALVIEFAHNSLPDGVYSLQLLDSIAADDDGQLLDGNRDGTAGGDFSFTGNSANRFYKINSEFSGDAGVSVFDFSSFSYWFGVDVPTAPIYVDMNDDGGVSVFDFSNFSANFGTSVNYPTGLIAPIAQPQPLPTAAELKSQERIITAAAESPQVVDRIMAQWINEPPVKAESELGWVRTDNEDAEGLLLESLLVAVGERVFSGGS